MLAAVRTYFTVWVRIHFDNTDRCKIVYVKQLFVYMFSSPKEFNCHAKIPEIASTPSPQFKIHSYLSIFHFVHITSAEYWNRIGFQSVCDVTNPSCRPRSSGRKFVLSSMNVKIVSNSLLTPTVLTVKLTHSTVVTRRTGTFKFYSSCQCEDFGVRNIYLYSP